MGPNSSHGLYGGYWRTRSLRAGSEGPTAKHRQDLGFQCYAVVLQRYIAPGPDARILTTRAVYSHAGKREARSVRLSYPEADNRAMSSPMPIRSGERAVIPT